MEIRIKRFDKELPLPETEERAAGFDLHCRDSVTIEPQSIELVRTNVAIEIPDGYFILLASRSSTPLKKGLMLANGVGFIDPFFNGDKDEIKVQLFNFTNKPVEVNRGEKLTQGILLKNEEAVWQEVNTFGHDGHGGYWK